MFNINPWEIAVIAVIVLLVFGPERLPEIAVQMGKWYREFRSAADAATSELTSELEAAARIAAQAEADAKAAARSVTRAAQTPPAKDRSGAGDAQADHDASRGAGTGSEDAVDDLPGESVDEEEAIPKSGGSADDAADGSTPDRAATAHAPRDADAEPTTGEEAAASGAQPDEPAS